MGELQTILLFLGLIGMGVAFHWIHRITKDIENNWRDQGVRGVGIRRCLGAFLGVAAVLLVFVPPVAACAAPPGPGWVRDPITDLVSMFGPTLLAFGVPAFFAVRTRSVPFKWVGVLAAIGFAVVVFTFTLLLAPNCGRYLPPAT